MEGLPSICEHTQVLEEQAMLLLVDRAFIWQVQPQLSCGNYPPFCIYLGHISLVLIAKILHPFVVCSPNQSGQYQCLNQSAYVANTVSLAEVFSLLHSACVKSLALIFYGCPFQRSQQTCHRKGQEELSNINSLHSHFSACLCQKNHPPHPQVTLKVEKLFAELV